MGPLSYREKMMAKERNLQEPIRLESKKNKMARTKVTVSKLKLLRWSRKPLQRRRRLLLPKKTL